MKRVLLIFSVFTIVLICFCLSGCESPQERRGITPLPQNQPQDWESKPYKNMGS